MQNLVCNSILLLFTFSFSVAFAKPYTYSEIHADSGIRGPKYSVIADELTALEQNHPELFKVYQYGKTRQGRPLLAVKMSLRNSNQNNEKAILITGATHGNEFLDIARKLPAEFAKELPNARSSITRYLEEGGAIYFVPIFNPDGYDNRKRSNSRNADLNRDFDLIPTGLKKFKQIETRSFVSFFDKELESENRQLKLVVDYHCCIGAIIYPWSYSKKRIPNEDYQTHRELGNMVYNIFGGYKYGSTGEVLGYSAKGTSKDYYYARFGALAFTFEGAKRVENKKLDQHVEMWRQFFAHQNQH